MAPEVYEKHPYNQSVDIYSFAICLWQMFSFRQPYQDCCSQDQFEKIIINRNFRPKVQSKWPLPIKLLINCGWSANMKERPSAQMALKLLQKELVALRLGNETELGHNRRRSTFFMHTSKMA